MLLESRVDDFNKTVKDLDAATIMYCIDQARGIPPLSLRLVFYYNGNIYTYLDYLNNSHLKETKIPTSIPKGSSATIEDEEFKASPRMNSRM